MKKVAFAYGVCFLFASLSYGQHPPKPNIIYIMADDLGYSDIGCFGSEINTPSLNALASQGIRFSNMRNASMCVISRSSFLTSRWWPGAGRGITKVAPENTLAVLLKNAGYRTGIIGKWHLSKTPQDFGFDYFFGFLGGFSNYFKGSEDYQLNGKRFTGFNSDFYSTDAFSDSAATFILQKKGVPRQPFFLYLSYQSPHNPLQAPKKDILKYRGKYLSGWQAIRDARMQQLKAYGILKANVLLPSYPQNLPSWELLSTEQKDLEDLRMAVYAAMVERMDAGIGRLIKALKESGQQENTLIVFMSDNGNDSFSVLDQQMLRQGLLPGDEASNWQLGTGWAYAGVTPWRLYKISQHAGGVTTGAIVSWPSVVKQRGSINHASLHIIDVMPTLLEAAGINKKNHHPLFKKINGQSFYGVFKGKNFSRSCPMFFQYMDNRAIRTKKWSLVEVDANGWELYDTNKDPLETNNLSTVYPNVVKKLAGKWTKWWTCQSGQTIYAPETTATSPHYKPQGDRGSGVQYHPSAMPDALRSKY